MGKGAGREFGKKSTVRLGRDAGCAGYSVAINRGRGCVFVLNLVLALFHSVVLFCSDKISSFTAREKRVRVSHRVSSTKL